MIWILLMVFVELGFPTPPHIVPSQTLCTRTREQLVLPLLLLLHGDKIRTFKFYTACPSCHYASLDER